MKMNFKNFMEKESNEADIKKTIKKLPKEHQEILKKYKLNFHKNNTLNGDDKNIGVLNTKSKKITIASPWNYGREFTLLHEIGHVVWEHLLTQDKKDKWKEISKKNKNADKDQPMEELFCMAYANYYANSKIVIHTNDDWEKFIKSI